MDNSTSKNLRIDGLICLSKNNGNVKEWALIEILTFGSNILIMIISMIDYSLLSSSNIDDVEKKIEEQI